MPFSKLSLLVAALCTGTLLFSTDGKLSLVSSGTGDFDNMTLKAHNTIKNGDVFFTMGGKAGKFSDLIKDKPLYDAGHGLFSRAVAEEGHGNVRIGDKSKDEVSALVKEYESIIRKTIKEGKNVVIIDNGDPTIYGPHIGFVQYFKEYNPTIVPGMSSFNAANAALQRAVIGGNKNSSGVTLTIGNTNNKLIEKLADTGSTMVFFMDRKFGEFITHLKTLYPHNTPIAIVINAGSEKEEKVIMGTLETIESTIGSDKIPFNHLVYVGNFAK